MESIEMEECFQMSGQETQASKLKDELYSCVQDVLSASTETRRLAEEKMKLMEITEEYGVYLVEVALQKDYLLSIRQMAAILMKKYVDKHWPYNDNDQILKSFTVRDRIRQLLLIGLGENYSKLRNAFAFCASRVAIIDWPENWPSLFEDINDLLRSKASSAVLGVLRFFQEMSKQIEYHRCDQIVAIIINQLYELLFEANMFKVDIRMETIYVLTLILNLHQHGHDLIRATIIPTLPALCKRMVFYLQQSDKSIFDYGLKATIMKLLTLFVNKFPKTFSQYLNPILPTIWSMVMNYGEFFTNSVIYDKEFVSEIEDGEGKIIGFVPLVLAIFEFINSIVDCSRLNSILLGVLPDILYYDMIFMQITKKMEENWASDPVNLTEDDANECFDTCVRVTAKDVLMMTCHEFDVNLVIPALCATLNRYLAEAESKKQNGNCCWWNMHEVCMYTLGLLNNLILTSYKNNTLQFDLSAYISHWQNAYQYSEHPLLLGRSIWFGGKYSSILPEQHFNNYMQTTISFLRHDEPFLRISALRTILAHCEEINTNTNKSLIILSLPTVFNYLIDNISEGPYFSQVLMNLETMKIILSLNKPLTSSVEPRVVPLLINLLLKQYFDPLIEQEIRSIIKEFCVTSECVSIYEKLVPVLTNVLNTNNEKVQPGFQAVAMDLMRTVVKFSKPPLNDVLILIAFPAVINCILHSDDQMLLQNGGECLRAYLLLGTEQIRAYTDSEGKTGFEYLLQATTQLLDPLFVEDTCRRLGRLVITLISKAGTAHAPSVHFILRAILSKMQRVQRMDVWQSLLIVFIHLFYTQLEAVVSFLSSIPGPTGASALEFVLVEWLNRQIYFQGLYARILSVMALTNLIEYSVTSENCNFDNILVRNDYRATIREGETIPLTAKALKIIVNEVFCQLEVNQSQDTDSDSYSSEHSQESSTSNLTQCYYETDSDQNDPLYSQDPIFQIDLLSHLTNFMNKLKTIPRFQWFAAYLTPKDKKIFNSLGIFY